MGPTFYELLGVPATATEERIKEALTQENRLWSRRASTSPSLEKRQEAERMLDQLREAQKTLLNPRARAAYDVRLSGTPVPAPPVDETPATGGDERSCQKCEHFRYGSSSIARAVFTEFPSRLQSGLLQAQNQKINEERQYAGQFTIMREGNIKDDNEEYIRRPRGKEFGYCGLDEFKNMYYCAEVKNRDFSCEDFKKYEPEAAAGTGPQSCKTCKHNLRPSDQVLQTLLDVVIREAKGAELRNEIIQALNFEALNEYQDCVDGAGMVSSRPGLLPLCEAWSSPDTDSGGSRYVVGPIVNAAERCAKWEKGSNRRYSEINNELNVLMAGYDEVFHQYAENFKMGALDAMQRTGDLSSYVGHAKADLIEFCLLSLGADSAEAESIAARYAQIWEVNSLQPGAQWVSQKDTRLRKSDAISAPPLLPKSGDVEGAAPAPFAAEGKTRRQTLLQLLPGYWQIEDSFLGGLKKTSERVLFAADGTLQHLASGHVANWSVTGSGKIKIWTTGQRAVFNDFSEIRPGRLVGTVRDSGSIVRGRTVWVRL